MTSTQTARLLAAPMVAFVSVAAPSLEASDFASTRPTARVGYWQHRQAAIQAQVSDATSLRAVKPVFVGDSITDFWLLGDDPRTQVGCTAAASGMSRSAAPCRRTSH